MRALRLLGVLLLVTGCTGTDHPAAVTSTPTPVVTISPTAVPTTAAPTPSPSTQRTLTPTPTPTVRPYPWSSRRVTAADLPHSWHAGCPVAPSQLRLLSLTYRDFAGARRTGQLVVNARVVDDVVAVFRRLYAARFPIRSMRLVDEYGGDDDASMAADNTSSFNCRNAVGGSGWSQHAYGLAIDVNPRENPYVYGGQVLPPEGRAYLDRSDHRRGMAYPASALNSSFAREGWSWGGRWKNPDYQHFSTNGQ